MEKLTYLLWGDAPDGDDRYRRLLVDGLAPELLDIGVGRLTVNVDDAHSTAASPVPTPPGEDPHVGQVSFWLDCHDRRGPAEEAITATGLRSAGYLVCEALYTDYGDNEHAAVRDWAPGTRSPGTLTVCCIHRPDGYDPTAWVRHWHGTQSPVSAAIQPRARYVRNEVVRPVTEGAPPVDGIVEEAWPSGRHIEDPMLFFCADGDPERMNANIEQMMRSVEGFIDMERMRNVTMSEYLFH